MPTLVLVIASAVVCQADQPQAAGAKCGSYCIYVALWGSTSSPSRTRASRRGCLRSIRTAIRSRTWNVSHRGLAPTRSRSRAIWKRSGD